jgi:hypothetical protein
MALRALDRVVSKVRTRKKGSFGDLGNGVAFMP